MAQLYQTQNLQRIYPTQKIFDRNPLLTQLADKYKVRDYVAENIGAEYLNPLLLVTTTPEEIDFAHLPDQFVIKATHGSHDNYFVKDKSKVAHDEMITLCRKWLSSNYYRVGREWCYKHIVPRIVVEPLIKDEAGNTPTEYKFFCFSGVPRFVSVHKDRFTEFKSCIYDMKWNKMPVRIKGKGTDWDAPKPANLDEMIGVNQKLSTGLDFVRVDLYSDDKRIVFGELTHYPDNGILKFMPAEYDHVYGEAWAAHLAEMS